MQIQNNPFPFQRPPLKYNDGGDSPKPPQEPKNQSPIVDFYDSYQTPIHLAGGALLGAGLAKFCGLPSDSIMSAAGTGAFAGFFAGSPKKAALMAGGAAVGAAIATMAGVPPAGVLGAAGTGTLVAFIFG